MAYSLLKIAIRKNNEVARDSIKEHLQQTAEERKEAEKQAQEAITQAPQLTLAAETEEKRAQERDRQGTLKLAQALRPPEQINDPEAWATWTEELGGLLAINHSKIADWSERFHKIAAHDPTTTSRLASDAWKQRIQSSDETLQTIAENREQELSNLREIQQQSEQKASAATIQAQKAEEAVKEAAPTEGALNEQLQTANQELNRLEEQKQLVNSQQQFIANLTRLHNEALENVNALKQVAEEKQKSLQLLQAVTEEIRTELEKQEKTYQRHLMRATARAQADREAFIATWPELLAPEALPELNKKQRSSRTKILQKIAQGFHSNLDWGSDILPNIFEEIGLAFPSSQNSAITADLPQPTSGIDPEFIEHPIYIDQKAEEIGRDYYQDKTGKTLNLPYLRKQHHQQQQIFSTLPQALHEEQTDILNATPEETARWKARKVADTSYQQLEQLQLKAQKRDNSQDGSNIDSQSDTRSHRSSRIIRSPKEQQATDEKLSLRQQAERAERTWEQLKELAEEKWRTDNKSTRTPEEARAYWQERDRKSVKAIDCAQNLRRWNAREKADQLQEEYKKAATSPTQLIKAREAAEQAERAWSRLVDEQQINKDKKDLLEIDRAANRIRKNLLIAHSRSSFTTQAGGYALPQQNPPPLKTAKKIKTPKENLLQETLEAVRNRLPGALDRLTAKKEEVKIALEKAVTSQDGAAYKQAKKLLKEANEQLKQAQEEDSLLASIEKNWSGKVALANEEAKVQLETAAQQHAQGNPHPWSELTSELHLLQKNSYNLIAHACNQLYGFAKKEPLQQAEGELEDAQSSYERLAARASNDSYDSYDSYDSFGSASDGGSNRGSIDLDNLLRNEEKVELNAAYQRTLSAEEHLESIKAGLQVSEELIRIGRLTPQELEYSIYDRVDAWNIAVDQYAIASEAFEKAAEAEESNDTASSELWNFIGEYCREVAIFQQASLAEETHEVFAAIEELKEAEQKAKQFSLEPVFKVAEADEEQGADGAQELSGLTSVMLRAPARPSSSLSSVDCENRFLENAKAFDQAWSNALQKAEMATNAWDKLLETSRKAKNAMTSSESKVLSPEERESGLYYHFSQLQLLPLKLRAQQLARLSDAAADKALKEGIENQEEFTTAWDKLFSASSTEEKAWSQLEEAYLRHRDTIPDLYQKSWNQKLAEVKSMVLEVREKETEAREKQKNILQEHLKDLKSNIESQAKETKIQAQAFEVQAKRAEAEANDFKAQAQELEQQVRRVEAEAKKAEEKAQATEASAKQEISKIRAEAKQTEQKALAAKAEANDDARRAEAQANDAEDRAKRAQAQAKRAEEKAQATEASAKQKINSIKAQANQAHQKALKAEQKAQVAEQKEQKLLTDLEGLRSKLRRIMQEETEKEQQELHRYQELERLAPQAPLASQAAEQGELRRKAAKEEARAAVTEAAPVIEAIRAGSIAIKELADSPLNKNSWNECVTQANKITQLASQRIWPPLQEAMEQCAVALKRAEAYGHDSDFVRTAENFLVKTRKIASASASAYAYAAAHAAAAAYSYAAAYASAYASASAYAYVSASASASAYASASTSASASAAAAAHASAYAAAHASASASASASANANASAYAFAFAAEDYARILRNASRKKLKYLSDNPNALNNLAKENINFSLDAAEKFSRFAKAVLEYRMVHERAEEPLPEHVKQKLESDINKIKSSLKNIKKLADAAKGNDTWTVHRNRAEQIVGITREKIWPVLERGIQDFFENPTEEKMVFIRELASAAGSIQLSVAATATSLADAEDAAQLAHAALETTAKIVNDSKAYWDNCWFTELGKENLTWSVQAAEKIAQFARAARDWRAIH